MENSNQNNYVIQLTPVYLNTLNQRERARLRETLKHNRKWKHAFFGPETMDYRLLKLEFPDSEIFRFPDEFFTSTTTYSKLLLDVNFYKTFGEFESILITQLDSIVVNEIPDKIIHDYDYVGAPWITPFSIFSIKQRLVMTSRKPFRRFSYDIWVGNGGLSIRNIATTIEVLNDFFANQDRYPRIKLNIDLNEDVVLSFLMKKYGKRIPSLETSRTIFLEADSVGVSEVGKLLGFHALDRFNQDLEEKILSVNPLNDHLIS